MPVIARIPTSRLTLRCWRPEDAAQLQESITSSGNELEDAIGWVKRAPLGETEQHLRRMQTDFLSGRAWVYGIFDLAETMVVGGLRLRPGDEPGLREMSYWIRTSCTGRGYATEAVAAATTHTFADETVDRIVIRCHCRNERGAAIPARLGYRLSESSRAPRAAVAGERDDAMVWELTRTGFKRMAAMPAEPRPWLS